MSTFERPRDILFNTGKIADPAAYAAERAPASWLYLCGEEFAAMEGGMSYAQVQAAAPVTRNIVSDPPRQLTLDLARQHVAALRELPRPTLVTCRMGPRSSAAVYLFGGLESGADPEDVIAAGVRDGAPFATSEELKAWIRTSLLALRAEQG